MRKYIPMYNTCSDSKGGQIKGLDVTFLMHILTEVFVIVKYSKYGKNGKKSKILQK